MIEIRGIFKRFGEKEVLKDVNASIDKGEIFTIIGPSGQGKSTLLRIINLLETPSKGQILFDGADIHAEKGRRMEFRRNMAMVFQKPVVFSTTVSENIATGLRYRGTDRQAIRERIEDALRVIGMEDFGGRKARTLSGGEMQRVALARAMVTNPEILLLDEPTANLDPIATDAIEALILRYNREFGTTVIMSTHDMLQGQRLADRIGVMMHGTFSQTGTPRDVFSTPKNKEVARFIGIENVLDGTITSTEAGIAKITLDKGEIQAVTELPVGTRVCGCIPPEDITLHLSHAKRISALNVMEGTITKIIAAGPVNELMIDCGISLVVTVTWKSVEELNLREGDNVRVSFKASAVHVMADTTSMPDSEVN
jgi:tungstate transport system ATP-binding protein